MVPTGHHGNALSLVFSIQTLNSSSSSQAAACHCWPATLFQQSPQIHRDEGSRLFPNSENTGSYITSIIFQALLRGLLQEAQFPERDVCHAPGDCGNCSVAFCKDIRVLRIKTLCLNPIHIKSDMIFFFNYLYC